MSRLKTALQIALGLGVGWIAGGTDGPLFAVLLAVGFGLVYTALMPHSKT